MNALKIFHPKAGKGKKEKKNSCILEKNIEFFSKERFEKRNSERKCILTKKVQARVKGINDGNSRIPSVK